MDAIFLYDDSYDVVLLCMTGYDYSEVDNVINTIKDTVEKYDLETEKLYYSGYDKIYEMILVGFMDKPRYNQEVVYYEGKMYTLWQCCKSR